MQNLLSLIRRFGDEEKPELFLTTLFDSQACERTFRLLRQMGTVNFTKITFTIFELMHMVRRVEVQNEIAYTKLPNVNLPKVEKPRTTTKIYALPNEDEIDQCLNRAKRFALDDALKFGMQIDSDDVEMCGLNIPKKLVSDVAKNEYLDDDDDDMLYDDVDDDHDVDDNDDICMMDSEHNTKTSYLTVQDPKNPEEEMLLRKSTLVWSLTEGRKKISSDRLIRVKNGQSKNNQVFEEPASTSNLPIKVSHLIKVGDWCFFKYNEPNINEMFCLGVVLAFKFNKGQTAKEKKYNGDFVDLKENPSHAEELDVLSSWYFVNNRAQLVPTKIANHHFIQLKNYIATVERPLIDFDIKTLHYSPDKFQEIENTILNLHKNA